MSVEPREVIAVMNLAANIPANSAGIKVCPAASQSTVVYLSTGPAAMAKATDVVPIDLRAAAIRYRRVIVSAYLSHALDCVIEGSMDGTNYRMSDTTTIAATTATVINYHVRTPHLRITFNETGANTLTTCEVVVEADPTSANPGI